MTKIALTSTSNFSDKAIDDAVARALDLLDLKLNNRIKNVVIKPNLCYYWDYSTGETTDPRVVSGVIDYVRSRIGDDADISVAEADASAMKTKYAFKALGYERLSEEKNVNLLNLSEGEIADIEVQVRDRVFNLPVNNVLLKADLIVNVPKLKTHRVAGVTCAMKNMFGAIAKPRKYVYHKMLSHAIVGINKVVRSDISLVDGLIARGSSPKKLGVLVAGDNPLATDFTAAEIMGFNPRRIEHLSIAEEEIGSIQDINLVEDDVKLKEVKDDFPSFSHFLNEFSWKMQLKMLRIYASIVGDVIPPVLEQ